MNYSDLGSVTTVVMMAVFIGIVLWAWSGKRREDFDAAARVPFEEDLPAEEIRRQAGH